MTINKDVMMMEVQCDICAELSDSFDLDDFNRMIATVKELGWRIIKVKGEWVHFCPTCSKADK
jgi:hypothetical protein